MTFQAENWKEHYKAVKARLCPTTSPIVDRPICLSRKRDATRYDYPIGPTRPGQRIYSYPIGPKWALPSVTKLRAEAAQLRRAEDKLRLEKDISTATAVVLRVARKHELAPAVLIGPRRQQHIIAARHEAIMAVVFACPKWSIAGIGRFFDLDHTSVLAVMRKHARKVVGNDNAHAV